MINVKYTYEKNLRRIKHEPKINILEIYIGIKVSKLVSYKETSVRARDYQIKTYQLHINKV